MPRNPIDWPFLTGFGSCLRSGLTVPQEDLAQILLSSSRTKKDRKILQIWKDLQNPTKFEEILSSDEELKDVRMADFMELLANLKSHRVDGVTLSKSFEPTEEQEKSIGDLHSWRNYFIHFLPGIRSFPALEYLSLMPNCIEFAEFLTQAPAVYLPKEAKESVSILKTQVESLRQKYVEKFPQLVTLLK